MHGFVAIGVQFDVIDATDRQTDMQIDRQTDMQIDRQTLATLFSL